MISYILIAIAILVGIYFYMQKSNHVEKDNNVPPTKSNFKFIMLFFKMDDKGLGYYLDSI